MYLFKEFYHQFFIDKNYAFPPPLQPSVDVHWGKDFEGKDGKIFSPAYTHGYILLTSRCAECGEPPPSQIQESSGAINHAPNHRQAGPAQATQLHPFACLLAGVPLPPAPRLAPLRRVAVVVAATGATVWVVGTRGMRWRVVSSGGGWRVVASGDGER